MNTINNLETLNEFQQHAMSTAIYPTNTPEGLHYATLKLASEAGEVAGKVGKMILAGTALEDVRKAIADELGDILFYIAACANEVGYTLKQIGNFNADKREDRVARGAVIGDGDQR